MGEVYRARDTRLAREVAIKVLPEASSFPHSTNRSGTRWPCCSSSCVTIKTLPPGSFGGYGCCHWRACVPVVFPAAVPGRLARHLWLRLCDPEPYRRTVAAILGKGVYVLSAGLLRGGGAHAVARDQRCPASGRGGLIVSGWREPIRPCFTRVERATGIDRMSVLEVIRFMAKGSGPT
jgi:hypothetical protein